MDGKSLHIAEDKKRQLKQLFPEIFAEDQIDLEKLKLILGEDALVGSERYELSWAGKYESFKEIQKQTTATLTPDREGSVNFDTSENIFIEGENLEVLRVLQKSYYGKIKMIYIDPPYNTGNDHFVYPDDFAERLEEYQKRAGIKDENGFLNKQDLWKKNTKENGQFHSVWLSMMYPRLFLARNLLQEDGVIFVSIDDNEAVNLKLIMDQIFGEENFLASFIWKRRQNADNRNLNNVSIDHEYVLAYSKTTVSRFLGNEIDTTKYKNPDNDPRGKWASIDLSGLATKEQRPNLHYDLVDPETGNRFPPNPARGWSKSKDTMQGLIENDEILFPSNPKGRPRQKKFLKDLKSTKTGFSSILKRAVVGYTTDGTKELTGLFSRRLFPFPKPSILLMELLKQATEENDLVLDYFAGSGSLAHAVLELNKRDLKNRKFILIQMPETTEEDGEARQEGYDTISDIAKARIHKVIEKIQAESTAKAKKPELFEGESKPQDLGFKSFKLNPSNFKTWRPDVSGKEELTKQLNVFQESLKDEPNHEALVYELLLKSGLALTAKVESKTLDHEGAETTYYLIDDGQFIFALHAMNSSLVQEMISHKPKAVITLDSLFDGNDAFMTNTHLQLKEAGIDFKVI